MHSDGDVHPFATDIKFDRINDNCFNSAFDLLIMRPTSDIHRLDYESKRLHFVEFVSCVYIPQVPVESFEVIFEMCLYTTY